MPDLRYSLPPGVLREGVLEQRVQVRAGRRHEGLPLPGPLPRERSPRQPDCRAASALGQGLQRPCWVASAPLGALWEAGLDPTAPLDLIPIITTSQRSL